jgi:hypothetical protein
MAVSARSLFILCQLKESTVCSLIWGGAWFFRSHFEVMNVHGVVKKEANNN